jgi:N-acetylglucosamine-6-phosphate deacetylase
MDDSTGFFDLQVNGYGGVDFNQEDLAAGDLHAVCERLAADGVGGILATFTTETLAKMVRRMANLVALRERDPLARRIIAGLHIEGPFISPLDGYRGAHPADAVRPASADEMRRLLDAGGGLVRLVTLAPECDEGLRLTRLLVRDGIVASAGHCDPTLDQLRAAADAGLSMFTHLGNGCADQVHRHDNIIHRALSLHDRLWLCFIADGVHVPVPALGNCLRAAGMERAVVVTDAVTPAGLGPGTYRQGRFQVRVAENDAARMMDGSLIGSAITMRQSVRNLVERLGLSEADARRLTVTNPRRAIGLEAG